MTNDPITLWPVAVWDQVRRLREGIPEGPAVIFIGPAVLERLGLTLEEARRVAKQTMDADLMLSQLIPTTTVTVARDPRPASDWRSKNPRFR